MRVGILTFHRAHNYGAVLQCYALQEVLKSMGHEVWVIDYRQPFVEELYSAINYKIIRKLWCHPRTLLNYLRTSIYRIKRKRIFQNFISSYINIDKNYRCKIQSELDAYIIGSDQVWSLHCLGGNKDEIYFGGFSHKIGAKVIGYAISTNMASLDVLLNDGLNEYLKKITALSMREFFASDFINNNTDCNSKVCIDPTLLANVNLWDNIINYKWSAESYVLTYLLRPCDGVYEKAVELANNLGCKVIDLTDLQYSVVDFVSLFKYAQYVITTSFHGTVFSILFNRPFYSVKLQDGHDGRIINLTRAVGLDECCVNKDFIPELRKVDFCMPNKLLDELKRDSLDFLIKNLGK